MSRLRRRASPEDAQRATARLQRLLDLPRAETAEARAADETAAPAGPGEGVVPEVDSLEAVRAALADRLPPETRGRVGLARPAATAVLVVAVVAVALGASYAWRARAVPAPLTPASAPSASVAEPDPLAAGSPGSAGSAGAEASPSPAPSEVVVDVAGKVRRPGVVRLPAGARVVDALEAAGGARPGVSLTTLNLARVLLDGEQILVGLPPERGATGSGAPGGYAQPSGGEPGAGTSSGGPIDLNTATLEQLDTLPGVGPVLAQRILDWRTAHGRFSSVEELQEVSGIGDARFADLAPRVTV